MSYNRGENNPNWKGGVARGSHGRCLIKKAEHPRANNKGYVFRYFLVVEKATGKYLPMSAVVHHVDGDQTNDHPSNLVVCENSSYHQLIHWRKRAIDACGQADWRMCSICKRYDALENFVGTAARHTHPRCFKRHRKGT